ncbi:MAG: hypothetical protein JXX14_05835 [Deltaproteobacteria bacterium]|nr:hypothetical protein [Deltaproteobacteria bacterium]
MIDSKKLVAILLLLTLSCTLGCGSQSVEVPVIVAQTVPVPADRGDSVADSAANASEKNSADPIAQLIERDAHTARNILVSALQSTDDLLASWAAVYIRLLKVEADPALVTEKLLLGSQGDDLLLKVLCYRWLVDDRQISPRSPKEKADPLLQLFFALTLLSHPSADSTDFVSRTLCIGQGITFHEEKTPLNTLLRQTAPFDNGPIALAIAFINARRMSLATEVEGIIVPRSAGYRQQLLAFFDIHKEMSLTKPSDNTFEFQATSVHLQLQNPLSVQPVQVLRNIIVNAADSLKKDGLRALATAAVMPEVGDFAAAASAFQNPDASIRVEAARTFLLLVTRAIRNS